MDGKSEADRVGSLLPLKPSWFHILLALREEAAHGFAIRSRVEERTAGGIRLWPVTLYGSIRQMVEEGLIEGLEGEEGAEADGRRRYYRLTGFGRAVLLAEADRLESLVREARMVQVGKRA
ncbi:MAG: PadR family transcriptional regulator [Longimicrobiales bacterium]